MTRAQTIENTLEEQLAPSFLEITDESSQHSGNRHESHFRIVIVSDRFAGMPLLARHRAVQDPLSGEFDRGLHALALHTYTAEEWTRRGGAAPDSPLCRGGGK